MAIARGNISSTALRFSESATLRHEISAGGTDRVLLVILGLNDAEADNPIFPATGTFQQASVAYSGLEPPSNFELTYTGSLQVAAPREEPHIAVYILTSPVTGTNQVNVEFGREVNDAFVGVVDYTGVDQSQPFDVPTKFASTSDANFDLGGIGIIPVTSGTTLVTCSVCPDTIGDHVPGINQILLFNSQEGNSQFSCSDKTVAGSGYTLMSTAGFPDYVAVSFTAALRPT